LVCEDDNVLACRWKALDTRPARLSEEAKKVHCWQGRARMAIDAIGLDPEGKTGEVRVVLSRDGDGKVDQSFVLSAGRDPTAQAKSGMRNAKADPKPGEALALYKSGKLVRLMPVLYKDPAAGFIITLETNEVDAIEQRPGGPLADAITCKPTFAFYSLL